MKNLLLDEETHYYLQLITVGNGKPTLGPVDYVTMLSKFLFSTPADLSPLKAKSLHQVADTLLPNGFCVHNHFKFAAFGISPVLISSIASNTAATEVDCQGLQFKQTHSKQPVAILQFSF